MENLETRVLISVKTRGQCWGDVFGGLRASQLETNKWLISVNAMVHQVMISLANLLEKTRASISVDAMQQWWGDYVGERSASFSIENLEKTRALISVKTASNSKGSCWSGTVHSGSRKTRAGRLGHLWVRDKFSFFHEKETHLKMCRPRVNESLHRHRLSPLLFVPDGEKFIPSDIFPQKA